MRFGGSARRRGPPGDTPGPGRRRPCGSRSRRSRSRYDEPTSFADGVAKLKSLGEDLADKLANNAGEAADDAVHDIGHLLEAVREQATKAGLTDAATKALDELEECFGKVDEAFHSAEADADPKKALESVKERLEAAFKALTEVK